MDHRLINIVLLGLAFMILFTAFQATTMLVPSVLEGLKNDTNNGTNFHISGFVSFAIAYGFLSVANIFAPVVVSILGPAVSMFVSGLVYIVYILSFISPMTWSFYLVSVSIGFGGAILWTANGAYLALNSDENTMSRNSGIFWALYQVSLLPGNLYVYLSLSTEIITQSTLYSLFLVFSTVAAVALVPFALIIWRTCIERRRSDSLRSNTEEKVRLFNVIQTLKVSVRLLKTRTMLLLLIPFVYTGLSQSLFQTVYGTCIGHSIKYGAARKRLIGLHGILLGTGGILGSGLFGFITKPKTSSQRALIVFLGFVLQMVFYYSVFVNFPFDAPAKETDSKSYFEFNSVTSQVVAFIGSFLVGLGDSSLNTQMLNVLASRYKETSASAFAISTLIQGIASAIAFLYAANLGLQYQLLIVTIFLLFSTLSFFAILFNNSNSDLITSFQLVDYPMY